MKAFLIRFFTKPPIFFPLLAIFHWVMTIIHFAGMEELNGEYLQKGLWFLTASVLMTALSFMKRWAGILYVLQTCAGLCLMFFFKDRDASVARVGQTLFPVDLIVCFLILFFYKRLEGWPVRAN